MGHTVCIILKRHPKRELYFTDGGVGIGERGHVHICGIGDIDGIDMGWTTTDFPIEEIKSCVDCGAWNSTYDELPRLKKEHTTYEREWKKKYGKKVKL